MTTRKQMSETFLISSILAIVGGFLDAYTYMCRGSVFANAQTGNIVLMGIKFSNGQIKESLFYLIPIFSFIAGILICEAIRQKFRNAKRIHWRQIVILFEIIVLSIVSFIPQAQISNNVSNALVSFVCSLQVQSFRKMNDHSIATTMCTGNLRSATEHFFNFVSNKNKDDLHQSLEYFGIIAFFILGGAMGALITNKLSIKAVLIANVGLIITFIIMFIKQEEQDKEEKLEK